MKAIHLYFGGSAITSIGFGISCSTVGGAMILFGSLTVAYSIFAAASKRESRW